MTSRNVPLNTKKSVTSFRQQFEATMGVSVATIEGKFYCSRLPQS